jgi:peptidoglycan hydrolase-like protein with peptidoglycan-binding domain
MLSSDYQGTHMSDSFVVLDLDTLEAVTGGCDEHDTPAPPAAARPSARQGSADITALQRVLASIGFNPGKLDGIMGPRTRRAIRAFQTRNRLKVDGIVGSQTRGALGNYGLT